MFANDTHQLQIEYRSIASLTPYANNARQHPKTQIKQIAKSLQKWGWTNPIIIDASGMILCGHGRFEAAKLLGMTKLPTIKLDHLNDDDRRAYIIADNALAEKAGWNKATLKGELKGLLELGYELELTGFTTLEIDTMLNIGGEESEVMEPAVELPDEWAPVVVRLGDQWDIGPHRFVCADATKFDSYEQLFRGLFAQMVFTDPPYGVKIAGNVSGLGRHKHGEFVMGSIDLDEAGLEAELLRPTFRNIAKFSQAGTIAFICMDWRGGRTLQNAADGVFAELKNRITWVKTNAGMGTFYRSQSEDIYAYKVSPGQHINNFGLGGGGRSRSNVWTYAGANTFRRGRDQDLADHPTVKSKRMVADAILDCSTPGGIILDPFLGSGTTLLAAHMTGRHGYGFELDPKYCDVILRRMQAETGLVPMLGDKTFAEIAAMRLSETDDG